MGVIERGSQKIAVKRRKGAAADRNITIIKRPEKISLNILSVFFKTLLLF